MVQMLLKLFGKLPASQKTKLLTAVGGILSGGGLATILGQLKSNGLSSQVDSWVGTGPNAKVSASQLQGAMPDLVGQVARESGVSEKQAASGLSKMLPGIVDKLSPGGKVAEGDQLSGMLGNLPKLLGLGK